MSLNYRLSKKNVAICVSVCVPVCVCWERRYACKCECVIVHVGEEHVCVHALGGTDNTDTVE